MPAISALGPSMPSAADCSARSGPPQPRLAQGAVHLWRADLTAVPDDLDELLCPAERSRAERIRGERERRLWTRARGVLRELLGRYLDSDPGTLSFTVGAHGKPALTGSSRLSFNLSHSRGLALYAFTEMGAVGVDVQLEPRPGTRRPIDEVALATRAFGRAEGRRLQGLDRATRRREFLRSWVRQEAELKQQGTGIGGGSTTRASPGRPWIAQLDVHRRAAAAIAVPEAPRELRYWDWSSPAGLGWKMT